MDTASNITEMGRMLARVALAGVVLSTSLACSYASDSEDLPWGASGTADVHLWKSRVEFEITPTKVVQNDDLLEAQPFLGLDFDPDHLWMVHYTAKVNPDWLNELMDEDVSFSDLQIRAGLDSSWSGDPDFKAGIRANGGDPVAAEKCPKLDLAEVADDGEASGCVFLVRDGDDEPLERIWFSDAGLDDNDLSWTVKDP